ncbi:hypothetical protein AAMO2058_000816400 [Amorphochlora amoebiformis]
MILNAVAGCGDCPTGGSGAWELVKFLTDLLNRAGIPPPNSGGRYIRILSALGLLVASRVLLSTPKDVIDSIEKRALEK